MERVSEHQACPSCGGVMMVNYNPNIVIERDEQCFRCGYFYISTAIREMEQTSVMRDFPEELQNNESHFFVVVDDNENHINEEHDKFQIKEETHQGYGCYGITRQDVSGEYGTFNTPITPDKVAEFQKKLQDDPFCLPNKSFLAAWDSERKEQIVLFGDKENIPDINSLSFEEWSAKNTK